MNSNIVNTQRPPIEIRTSSGVCSLSDASELSNAAGSNSASESGVASGSSTRAPIVASQKSPAKALLTTRSGSSPSL